MGMIVPENGAQSYTGARMNTQNTSLEINKATVLAFYALAFRDRQPAAAVAQYVGDRYIQHNPEVADGKQAFIDFVSGFTRRYPQLRIETRRVIAEGDLVVLHLRVSGGPGGGDAMVADIFRLENAKIVEHWDVIQTIPKRAANSNGMD
jgi:predicted SnoaL-like aldol condensation-catalyzing enzyme